MNLDRIHRKAAKAEAKQYGVDVAKFDVQTSLGRFIGRAGFERFMRWYQPDVWPWRKDPEEITGEQTDMLMGTVDDGS